MSSESIIDQTLQLLQAYPMCNFRSKSAAGEPDSRLGHTSDDFPLAQDFTGFVYVSTWTSGSFSFTEDWE